MTDFGGRDILSLADARFHEGISAPNLHMTSAAYGFDLPSSHQELLIKANGIEAYGGLVRMFGLGANALMDAILWNNNEYWKFAWNGRCDKYWCFAETAWGDQYAYAVDDKGKLSGERVYLLDCLSMTPQLIADSFEEFMKREFFRIATDPYDFMLKAARKKFGNVSISDHLTYAPSILLGGQEIVDNICIVNARSCMIINGDIAVQLDQIPDDQIIKSVEIYIDEQERERIRLVLS